MKDELRDIRQKLARDGSTVRQVMAKIVGVSADGSTATINVSGVVMAGVPLLGAYVPDLDHEVPVLLFGNAPVIMPPGQPVLITTRGRLDSTGGDNKLRNPGFETLRPQLVSNDAFEYGLATWLAGNAQTTLTQTGVQFHSGTKSAQLQCTVVNSTLLLTQTNNHEDMQPVVPYMRYQVSAWVRAAATGRSIAFTVDWYAVTGVLISEETTSSVGFDPVGSWTMFTGFMNSPASAVFARITLSIGVGNCALNEVHYVDDVGFYEAVPGWDCATSAKAWTFDVNTESWIGDSATLAYYAGGDPFPIAGLGALRLTRVAGSGVYGAHSPVATGGVPITPGFPVIASAWVRGAPGSPSRSCTLAITWYTAAGATISTTTGPVTTSGTREWMAVTCTATAPGTAVFMSLKVATNGGAANEVLYVDSAFLTIPTSTEITISTDPTYAHTGARSMAMKCLASGIVNAVCPPGSAGAATLTQGLAVTPGEYWDVMFWYKNDTANAVKRSLFTVTMFYAADGSFLTPIIGNYPVTSAGSGWTPAHETFLVPSGAAFMRIVVVYLGTTSDVVYVDDVEARRNSIIRAKIQPQGDMLNVSMRVNEQPLVVSSLFVTAGVWAVSPSYPVSNPLTPVQFRAIFTGYAECTATIDLQVRVGISFDNGLTWNYGVAPHQLCVLSGFGTLDIISAAHMLTGMPTDQIIYRLEVNSNVNSTPSIKNGTFLIDVLPAPAAGST